MEGDRALSVIHTELRGPGKRPPRAGILGANHHAHAISSTRRSPREGSVSRTSASSKRLLRFVRSWTLSLRWGSRAW
jgi:hypothetical protein